MTLDNIIFCQDCEVFIELDNQNPRWRDQYESARRNRFLLNHKEHNLKYGKDYQEIIEDGK